MTQEVGGSSVLYSSFYQEGASKYLAKLPIYLVRSKDT